MLRIRLLNRMMFLGFSLLFGDFFEGFQMAAIQTQDNVDFCFLGIALDFSCSRSHSGEAIERFFGVYLNNLVGLVARKFQKSFDGGAQLGRHLKPS
jgi:hypothetical protein